jgi:ABC-type Fe3+/spermidine/putrescine transport system ATPase subunit
VEGVGFAYGPRAVLRDVSFAVPQGGFLTLLGPSGCGKTTLLRLIGGYLEPDRGDVHFGDRRVTRTPPEHRNVGTVFQNYALFPHLSAWKNVAFPLEVRGLPAAAVAKRVDEMLARVGLSPADARRKPAALSGGQQQRVAVARAMIFDPDLLLLDEPFANLDRHLRDQLRSELRRLQRELGVATILVTHDQEEALAVSDAIGVMADGKLLQVGDPTDLYRRPRTPFVARFLGESNLLSAREVGIDRDGTILVRPEDLVLDPDATTGPRCWSGTVEAVAFQGADVVATVRCERVELRVRSRSRSLLRPGQAVRVGVPDAAVWVIPETDEG